MKENMGLSVAVKGKWSWEGTRMVVLGGKDGGGGRRVTRGAAGVVRVWDARGSAEG